MQSIPDGVELYVHRLIHESLTRELVREYHATYNCDRYNNIIFKNTYHHAVANFRLLNVTSFLNYISGLSKSSCGLRLYDNNEPVRLPKRYFFSSGMNSLEGYKLTN